MTGMIRESTQGEVCPGCRRIADLRDWTCPQCGYILDRFLFSTVTAKTVTGEDKGAFRAGYEDCMRRWKATGSTEVADYRPPSGHETSYRAGWQNAADKIEAKHERKRGRRRGFQLLGSGALLTAVGGSMLAGGVVVAWNLIILGAGILNLVLGIVSVITGNSDECPDDVPGTPAYTRPARAVLPVALPSGSQEAQTAVPGVFLTWAVVALNILVFLGMLAGGVNILSPSADALVRWGANFGPRTTAGEWWRLVTSMFLHIGPLHIIFNMFALLNIGPMIERLLGKAGFALVYLVAGVAGGIASLAWNPYLVCAGASGAIFGLYGLLIGFLAVQGKRLSSEAVSPLLKSALSFIGYNVIFGLTNPNIDLAAHAGGLVSGLICGVTLGLPPIVQRLRRRVLRNAVAAVLATPVLLVAAAKLPHVVDLRAHIQQLAALETRTLAKYNSALQQLRKREIPPAEFASVIENQVLPDWNAEQMTLASLHGLPARQARINSMLVQYMKLRRDAWLTLAGGAKDGKPDKLIEATRKQQEAAEQIKELTRYIKTP